MGRRHWNNKSVINIKSEERIPMEWNTKSLNPENNFLTSSVGY